MIIFDCDGTLVDSELLYNTVISGLLRESGFMQYTPDKCLELFTGLTLSNIRAIVEQEHQVELSAQLSSDIYVQRAHEQMDQGLAPIAGAAGLLARVRAAGYKMCVASNGERSSVFKSLKLTGLYDYFENGESQIFTKIQVQNAKPAPDLFLFAAERMSVPPAECVVVEDSVAGVRAGVAAGMQVIGFTGSHHHPAEHGRILKEAGAARVFSDLIHIADDLQGEKFFQKAG